MVYLVTSDLVTFDSCTLYSNDMHTIAKCQMIDLTWQNKPQIKIKIVHSLWCRTRNDASSMKPNWLWEYIPITRISAYIILIIILFILLLTSQLILDHRQHIQHTLTQMSYVISTLDCIRGIWFLQSKSESESGVRYHIFRHSYM